MSKKKCPMLVESYQLHDLLSINDSLQGRTIRADNLESVLGDINTIGRGELSDLSVNNYFPNNGESGGYGCMI